ncbi:hypothetical protein [Okeania sp. SIO1I7]|uniref:hypothetical protein n=1 Tax=Okeania sp. SIO1I7 TaxID=2607772 RepID=UPI0013F9B46F|nr:hypothetical protein [Okeania sp. SIO1I7]NET24812.1 hypothetical protein [Okeania sp. SIO1I7]
MDTWIIQLHRSTNEITFLAISALSAIIFCFWFIPIATDTMVNSAAGLAEKYLGKNQRTIVINSSTNNPELFLMLLSLSLGRLGGIATPLGSNFANIYLMFIVAPIIVIGKWVFLGKISNIKSFIEVLNKEKMLFLWHFSMSLSMFAFATTAYWCITGESEFSPLPEVIDSRTLPWVIVGGITCLAGIFVFFVYEKQFKQKRPELFEDINADDYEPSWWKFVVGTALLILLCYILNTLFIAWTEIYDDLLTKLFGDSIFAGLHYFLGSLISSLPETIVAVKNYERLTSPDLNTAMASASQSNMTNLGIGFLGSVLASLLLAIGINYQL